MATRTELSVYQLGLRLFQARELHDPCYLDQATALVQLSIVRLEQSVGLLSRIPELAPAVQSAQNTIGLWGNTPNYYNSLRSTESWQYDNPMQQHRDQLALIQEQFRLAVLQHPIERGLDNWLALGASILSLQDNNDRQVIDRLLSNLGLDYDALLPDNDLSVTELDHELHESYFYGLDEPSACFSNRNLWDTAELGLQRLWKSVEQDRTDLRNAVTEAPVGAVADVLTSSDPARLTPEERGTLETLKANIMATAPEKEYIGTSDAILRVFETISQLNREPEKPILLTGETGVGKSEIAEWIHKSSDRRQGPFGRVSAADSSGSDQTIWRGKWAGYGPNSGLANMDPKGQQGYLQRYAHGTLFLDEVGDCSNDGQTYLLDVIDRKPIHPAVGEGNSYTPDVRLIFATNKNLDEMVSRNEFRHDLYDRIQRRCILIPPLRDRREDIFDFAAKVCTDFTPAASFLLCLLKHNWPGNIRELTDALQHAASEAKARQTNGSASKSLAIADLEGFRTVSGWAAVINEVRDLPNGDCEKEVYLFLRNMLQRRGWQHGQGLQVEMARIWGVSASTVSRMRGKYDDATAS